MGWNFEIVAQRGEQDPKNNRIATLFLYPNDWSTNDLIQSDGRITKSIEQGLDTLYYNSSIDYYEVYRYTEGPLGLDDDTDDQFKDAFGGPDDNDSDGWLEKQGYYPDQIGCHVGVASGFDHGGGPAPIWYLNRGDNDPDAAGDNTAFDRSRWMIVGTEALSDSSSPDDRVDAFAIQEPLHAFIAHQVTYDTDSTLVKDDSYSHEHDLGKIWGSNDAGPQGATSAMATLWNGVNNTDHASHGKCSTGLDWGGEYDNTLTDCTVDAVRYTADDST